MRHAGAASRRIRRLKLHLTVSPKETCLMNANVLPRGSHRQNRASSPLLALVGACAASVFLCAEASAWQTNVSGTAGGGMFNATAVDGAGNVVAAGYTTNTDTGGDFTVAKLDGTSGTELWRYSFSFAAGVGPYSDTALAVALDRSGHVIAAGTIWYYNASSGRPIKWSEMLVVKLNGTNGAEVWRQAISAPTGNDADPTGLENAAFSVNIDAADNIVVAGALDYGPIVIKLDANG